MFTLRVVFCAVLVAVAVQAARVPRNEKYTTKYDNIDVDEILRSERLLKSYTNCMLDKGKCTPDGQELKSNLPEALTNECSKCSEKQKDGADKVLRHLINNKPELWSELEKKYDPSGIYKAKYDERFKELKSS